jgi:hypothetical protein
VWSNECHGIFHLDVQGYQYGLKLVRDGKIGAGGLMGMSHRPSGGAFLPRPVSSKKRFSTPLFTCFIGVGSGAVPVVDLGTAGREW